MVFLRDVRRFRDWNEDLYYKCEHNEGDPEVLTDDDYVLIHDDYTVNKSSNANKSIIWDESKVTEEWKRFCDEVLKIGHWN